MSDEALAERLPETAEPAEPAKQEPHEIPDYILAAAEAIASYAPILRALNPPCKLTPALTVTLLSGIRAGCHYHTACARAGVSYRAFREWMNRAEDEGDDGPFAALAHAVKVAEAEAVYETVCDVRVAAKTPKFWAAGMTFLERRHPEDWKRRDDNSLQVSLSVAIGVQADEAQRRAMVPVVVIQQSPESLDKMDRPHGTESLSPALETASALSPAPDTAVSDVQTEAKATPIEGVSPPSVA